MHLTDKVLQPIPCNLYSQSNFAFISRLPTELLESIFILLACHHFWSDIYPSSRHHLPDWIHVALVSSHWHNVALNCATLWSYITASPLRWIEISLTRSKQAPLKIHIDTRYQKSLVSVEKILKHAQRIETLCFHTYYWDAQNSQIFATICSSASQLRTLVFSIDRSMGINTPVSSDLYRLCGLTTLNLHSVPHSLRQDVLAFQAVLKCMPDLRHLHLEDALASAHDFISCVAFDTLQKIDLPCLSGLLIVAPFSTVIAFLSSINIPASAEMKLWCRREGEGDFSLHDCDRLCSVLAPDYGNGLVLPTIRSVVIEHNFRRVALAFSTSSRCDRCPSLAPSTSLTWGRGICLEIVVELPSTLHSSTLASRICVSMPTTNTQTLHVIHPPFPRAFWREILGGLQQLQRIKLSHGCMPDVLACVLLPQIAEDVAEIYGKDQILVSGLEELELVDIEFWAGHWSDSDSDSDREILVPALGLDSVSFWKRRAPYKISTGGSNLEFPPFEELEALCAALSNRKGSRGRLTTTKCHLDSNHHPFLYDFTGQWEGGQFHVVDMHCYPDPRLEEFLEWTALWELGRNPGL